jgi:hypothetical protein
MVRKQTRRKKRIARNSAQLAFELGDVLTSTAGTLLKVATFYFEYAERFLEAQKKKPPPGKRRRNNVHEL